MEEVCKGGEPCKGEKGCNGGQRCKAGEGCQGRGLAGRGGGVETFVLPGQDPLGAPKRLYSTIRASS